MPKCVELSLSLLADKSDERPLCLLTLPPPETSLQDIQKIIHRSKRNPDKNAVGRLISIVEMVKRNFSEDGLNHGTQTRKLDASSLNDTGTNQLHQYNEYGCLESLILERSKDPQTSESERRENALLLHEKIMKEFLNENRKRPRQSHTPWLKIYLSRTKILSLEDVPNVSYQKPSLVPSSMNPSSTDPAPPFLNLETHQSQILEEEASIAPV